MIYQLEILNPEVQAVLDSLVRLNLIKLHKVDPVKEDFLDILERLRTKGDEPELSEEEIRREVETVRAARYARKTQGHH